MPVSSASFTAPQDPISKLQKLMKTLERGSIEAHFTDMRGEPSISREYVEMIFQDYAISQQNPQIMNKWISLDTKLDKSLLEYVSDVKMLIASVTQTGTAMQAVAAPPEEGMSPAVGEVPSAQDNQLPVQKMAASTSSKEKLGVNDEHERV